VLPPAEACRFLVDLANLRGGPDNITVVVVRVGGQGGSSTASTRRRRGSLLHLVPWWALSLIVATGLAIGATILGRAQSYILAILLFIAALAGVIAGMIGLFIHYQDEQNRPESDDDEDRPPPRTHRRRPCKIERPLLDKLVRALRFLRQRADEKHWEPDWNLFQEHQSLADELLAKGDLAAAFREYCRAMLPLTRAQSERRQKEEVFTPVWDKSR
jgi:protein phosphatase